MHGSTEYAAAIYILANQRNGTLYVGVTNDLVRRAWEHKNDFVDGFTRRYGIHRLVYYELHADIREALLREQRLKRWRRRWKIALIERMNPTWRDLWSEII